MTHNEIIAFFREFALNHYLINSFANGKKQEVTSVSAVFFPTALMWVMLGPVNIEGNVRKSEYNFLFGDILNKDNSNLDEVLSDQLRIAEDFIATMRSPDYEARFQITDQSPLTHFQDEVFDNEMGGWELKMIIQSDYEQDVCQIPSSGNPSGHETTMPVNTTETNTVTGSTLNLGHIPLFIYGVYKNGQRLTVGVDYTLSGVTITFINALSNDSITIVYTY